MSTSKRGYKVIPNPWPPDSIERLIEHAITWVGLAPVVYKVIALWIEDRKARKIKIKCGEHELEIQGGMSGKEIERALGKFRKLVGEIDEDDLKIILPSGVDRSVPVEMVREANQRKSNK
jgi:hypothetical protein